MSDRERVDVFAYLNAREYLAAHFAHTKALRPSFSYRAFARLAKLKSPNYLKLVIDDKRNLSPAMAERFAKACGLDGDRAAYFLELVRFTQASTNRDRDEAYAAMSGFRGYQKVHALSEEIAEYHARWYIPAIRELAGRADFRADPAWIAATLVPKIEKSQAARALEVLLRLQLLKETADGGVERSDTLLSTGEQTRSVHMVRYHREMLECAGRALHEMSGAEREVSGVTLCVGEGGLERLKAATRALRRELLALEPREENPRQVFHVNINVFPLSRLDGPED